MNCIFSGCKAKHYKEDLCQDHFKRWYKEKPKRFADLSEVYVSMLKFKPKNNNLKGKLG